MNLQNWETTIQQITAESNQEVKEAGKQRVLTSLANQAWSGTYEPACLSDRHDCARSATPNYLGNSGGALRLLAASRMHTRPCTDRKGFQVVFCLMRSRFCEVHTMLASE